MKFTIEVNADDIAHGATHNPRFCPIAYGIRRVFGTDKDVIIKPNPTDPGGAWFAHVLSSKSSLSFLLPNDAALKAHHYDCSGEMEPFAFELEV